MKTIAPIVGFGHSVLKERVDFLLSERGYSAQWIDDKNISTLQKAAHAQTNVPIIIVVEESSSAIKHDDLLHSLVSHFPSALLISAKETNLPDMIFALQPQLSLWENHSASDLIRKTINHIYTHIGDVELNVAYLAINVNVSRSKLQAEFKELYGFGVWNFVKKIRLAQSKRLLIETIDPVSEIATSVGYSDFRAFDKEFKKLHKQTPNEFRSENTRKILNNTRSGRNDTLFGQKDTFFGQNA